MATKPILITGGYVVTGDPQLGDLATGDVLVSGHSIVAVKARLDSADLVAAGVDPTDVELIGATGMVVLPGFVDAHRHTWQGAIGGAAGGVTLGGYFGVILAGLVDKYRPEDVYAGVLWGALQALNAGITTVADWSHIVTTPAHADENIRALQNSGIRSVFLYGPPVGDGLQKWFMESTEPHPADVRRVRTDLLADDQALVTMGLALRGPEFATPEITGSDVRLARELALPMSLHSGLPAYNSKYRTIETLEKVAGLGPDMHHVHGAHFTDDDLRRIAATGGHITACPTVDMQMGMGTFPVSGRAIAHGLQPSFGVDTIAGTGTDLFGEMRTALTAERARAHAQLLARDELPSTVEISHRDVFRYATSAGALPWGLADRIGSLMPGRRADVVLIDTTRPHLDPLNDPITTIVLNAGPADVDTVIVDGRILKRSGQLTGAADHAREALLASRRYLINAAGLVDVLGPTWGDGPPDETGRRIVAEVAIDD